MQDLNDLYYFAEVIRCGGFSAASRALSIPKSRLSRHIARLEERLGLRLLQRSTRQLHLTQIGRVYYQYCLAMVANAEAAQGAVERAHSEPQGFIYLSCPVILAQTLLVEILTEFMSLHPKVLIRLKSTNSEAKLIEEGLAVALRAHLLPPHDSCLVARHLGNAKLILVASPQYLALYGHPRCPEELAGMDHLYPTQFFAQGELQLTGPDGTIRKIISVPKIATDDLMVLKRAAILSKGIATLPQQLCVPDLENGTLEIVLPNWSPPALQIHLIYPSRRGMAPAVRNFIDFVSSRLPMLLH